MGFTEVSSSQRAGEQNNGAPINIAFPGNVTAGNLLIATLELFSTGTRPTGFTVSDDRGTEYTVQYTTHSTEQAVAIAYGIAPSGGANTVTWAPTGGSGTDYYGLSVDEFAGQHATPFDAYSGLSSGTGTSATRSITTGADGCLLITSFIHNTGGSPTISAVSGTLIAKYEDSAGGQPGAGMFRIVGTAGSYTEEISTSASVDWALIVLSFKPAVGGDVPMKRGTFQPFLAQ